MTNKLFGLLLLVSLLGIEVVYCQSTADIFNRDKKPKQEKRDIRLPFKSALDEKLQDEDRSRSLLDQQRRRGLEELTAQPLEGAIDADTYIVGPGDQFMINIWSSMEDYFVATVTPEGKLVIPTIGSLPVYGETLARVKEMVRTYGEKKYLQTKIDANLISLRGIRVHVAGQILFPGSYEAYTIHRVNDVIEVAGGLTSWAYNREIQVRHLDGTMDHVDLYRYQKLGDLEANPFLRGGDVIFIPTIDMNQPSVTVEGMVNDPGSYQIQEGEQLMDFLLRVDAMSRRSDLEAAYVKRQENGEEKKIPIFPYLHNKGNGHSNLQLQNGDVLMIPQRIEDVYVMGAVQYPGPYPFIPGLKVRDYVGFAGGMYQTTNIGKAKLVRKGSSEEMKGSELAVSAGDVVYVPRKMELRVGEIASVIAALATTILTIDNIRRR